MDRRTLKKAVEKFLESGGKIKKLVPDDDSFKRSLEIKGDDSHRFLTDDAAWRRIRSR